MMLEEFLTSKEMIFKTKMCFCEFCNGYGFTVSHFAFYKKHKTSSYNTCTACKGTGRRRNWWQIKRTAIEKLINAKKRYLPVAKDFTAEQIRSISKKNLKYLHDKKKMSIIKIAKHLNMSTESVRGRFKLHGIESQFKKVKKIID